MTGGVLASAPVLANENASLFEAKEESEESHAALDFLSRSALTGDWSGARSFLADRGISLDIRHTSFYQGQMAGTGDQGFDYGGKFDLFAALDSEKLGLWEGGGFQTHVEFSHGELDTNLGGVLFATNSALYWPVDSAEDVVATSLYFTQSVGDRAQVAIGKFNPVDLLASDPFYGGWGIERFSNLILTAPPSGLIPVVFMGAVATIQSAPLTWTLMAFDPNDRTRDYFPGDLFDDGVNVSVSAAHATRLAGRNTIYALTGLYSTADGVDFSSIGGGALNTSSKSGAWNFAFEFRHNLAESGDSSKAAWGLYLKAAIADGNPNYVQRSLIAGVAGKALAFGRPQDSFGFGVFYYNLSDVLEDTVNPAALIGDETGLEIFYNAALTPWLWFGPSVQYVKPARERFDNALVAGLRLQIRL